MRSALRLPKSDLHASRETLALDELGCDDGADPEREHARGGSAAAAGQGSDEATRQQAAWPRGTHQAEPKATRDNFSEVNDQQGEPKLKGHSSAL